MSFTLAHITDLHMGPMVSFGPRYWSPKRLLGVLNWHRGRKHDHRIDVLEKIVADMLAQSPDHIAVTGDLVNIGLPREHERALNWLRKLSPPDQVSVIPGNHDIYTDLSRDEGVMRWRDYMTGEMWRRGIPDPDPADPAAAGQGSEIGSGRDNVIFPYLRRLGPIALIGLNSAVPTKPFIAAGELGKAQRDRLARLLALTRSPGVWRVVLIHHPPLPGQAGAMRGLRDAEQLSQILSEHGAELVLHGHNHRNMFSWLPPSSENKSKNKSEDGSDNGATAGASGGGVPVIGAPSASMARTHHGEPLARYNIYRFESGGPFHRDRPASPIEMIGRGLEEPGGNIVELERRAIDPCQPLSE